MASKLNASKVNPNVFGPVRMAFLRTPTFIPFMNYSSAVLRLSKEEKAMLARRRDFGVFQDVYRLQHYQNVFLLLRMTSVLTTLS